MISPHFPPDSSAGTHRVRLIAPHLPAFGWEPIILTVQPDRYEHAIEPELNRLIPSGLRVIRCAAWSPRWTRRFGIGDLGLRAFVPALGAAWNVLERERVDVVFITTYPVYTAGLGPLLKRRFRVPFILDLQDPWVGAWGRTVGGGRDGTPDFKSRASRTLARAMEAPVLRAADAITAVSTRTIEEMWSRVPAARATRTLEIPIGGDARDFDEVSRRQIPQPYFNPHDGCVHLCAVGTLLPRGISVVTTLFQGLARLRSVHPAAASRLRLHFFGTSNERKEGVAGRALPLAEPEGVADLVSEHPTRIDYLDAIRVQLDSSGLILLGSEEPHYTASKLFPALLARRPLLAMYHEASGVTGILRQHTRPPSVRLITFDSDNPVSSRTGAVAAALGALAEGLEYRAADVDRAAMTEYSARAIAGRLASLFSTASR